MSLIIIRKSLLIQILFVGKYIPILFIFKFYISYFFVLSFLVCIIMTNPVQSANFGNICYISNSNYFFMHFHFIDQQPHPHLHHEQPENIYLFEDLDSRYHHPPHIDNTLSITYANNKLPRTTQLHAQDLSMDIFEQSGRKQRDLPLFYKLSQDYKDQQDKGSSSQKVEKRHIRKQKNDTKNIPKNFGKGIMNFIEKHEKKIKRLISQHNLNSVEFFKMVRHEKKTINTIADLRRLWTNDKFGCVMRMVSNLFLREYAIEYIFNSRISSYSTHIKYRHILWSALRDPSNFNHIKQY